MSRRPTRAVLVAVVAALGASLGAARAGAQVAAAPAPDSLATVRVLVRHDAMPVERAIVRAGRAAAQTDALGGAVLRLPPGAHVVIATRIGFVPDTLSLVLRAAQDTTVTLSLAEQAEGLERVVVSATRGDRRVEDTPLRVEVIDEEEIAEKVAMTPGDVAMMLNETSGLRVQPTNPSLGGAGVRVQGLRGRYALLLADGLPLHGGQSGGLGLLQIPPVDLARVEVIKGTASALYGSAALGGVVNLVSRRPGDEAERTLLVNRTSRGGTDGVAFASGPLAPRWGWTALAGAHHQERVDVDGDGWTDLPGYARGVLRPRLYWDDGAGHVAFVTAGATVEDREGGTLPGRVAPDGAPFAERLRTRRGDVGGLLRWTLDSAGALGGAILSVRGSAMEQRHAHRFGAVREDDRHRTAFAEASAAVPRGAATWIAGAAWQRDAYAAEDVDGFDYAFTVPALFAQLDADVASWLAVSSSVRADAHGEYGTFVNPRVSVLVRRAAGDADAPFAGWTARLSGGTGAFAPTPFTEETEATGLAFVAPLAGLRAERANSASLDLGGPVATPMGRLEVNATAFASRIRHPVLARAGAPRAGESFATLVLANAVLPTNTWGADAFARLRIEDVLAGDLGLLATYVFLRATEEDPDGGGRREVPLTPRHAAGFDAIWEREGEARIGLELFYTGRQRLDDDPYRATSRPYLLVGLLGEWRVGPARVFANGENLTGVRQTRWSPLVRPARGPGGRWSTDAWTELAGVTVNAGVRLAF